MHNFYTSKTKYLLSEKLFSNLKKGTYLINVSRGKVQNESDILKFLNNGILSGAFLDVFEEEPLPKKSPLWNKKNVQINPHNVFLTNSMLHLDLIFLIQQLLFSFGYFFST